MRAEFSLQRDHRAVTRRTVVREHAQCVQGRNFVEDGKPARRRAAVTEYTGHNLVLHHVARDQGSVWFHERQFIALRVRAAEPEKPRCYTAQVELSLLLKCDVG